MVGALARLNIKFDKLQPEEKKAADIIGFKKSVKNPFFKSSPCP
jgi:hypothetical protein